MTYSVAVIVGSLRKASFSRRLAKALASVAPADLKLDIVEIGDLPMYDQDLEEGAPPPAWLAFRERIRSVDGVLFITPEYNRGLPGVLKNAIDVGSRPYGQSAWNGKPAAIVSNSPGALGGYGANHQLRQSLVFLNMPPMQQPEAYIAQIHTLLSDQDEPIDDKTREFFSSLTAAFAKWIDAHAKA